MLLILLAVLAVALYGAKWTGKGIRPDYLSIQSTRAVKGIFVMLVFLRHYKTCVSLTDALDRPFIKVNNWLGQLIVALFLFYSGYGVYASYQKKGKDYVRTMPRKRVLTTLVHFDLAVLLYLLADWLLGYSYSWKQVLAALLAWNTVGNSNWFIWAILALYLASWLALRLLPAGLWQPLAVTAFSAVYAVLFFRAYPESHWWYDTILCYAAGMWYSLYQPRIEALVSREGSWWAAEVLLLVLGGTLFRFRGNMAVYEVLAVVFSLFGVLLTMKVSFGNRVLQWLGGMVFPIYILQRLPMMVLSHFGVNERPWLFLAASLPLTLLLAAAFDWSLKRLDAALFRRKTAVGKAENKKIPESAKNR